MSESEQKEVVARLSVTYTKWDEASLAAGEALEVGTHHESDSYDAAELARLARDLGLHEVAVEMTGEGVRASMASVTPAENREFFEEGISTFYTAHLESVNGEPVDLESVKDVVSVMELQVPAWVRDLDHSPEELGSPGPGF